MIKGEIDINILNIVRKYIDLISRYYNIQEVYLFGSYAKGTNNNDSDIDIAIVINSKDNAFDLLVDLMMYTQEIDLRIEPHPIKVEAFKEGNPFIQEIMDTGLKIA